MDSISTVHALSSREKSRQSRDSNLGQLGEKYKHYLLLCRPPNLNSSEGRFLELVVLVVGYLGGSSDLWFLVRYMTISMVVPERGEEALLLPN